MKYKLILAAALTAVLATAADPVLYIPELKPITVQWEHDRRWSSPGTSYNIYHGTNLVQKVSTNDFVIVAVTNLIPTLQASILFDHSFVGPDATNKLTVRAFEPLVPIESDPSTNILIAHVVGKPLPPSGTRKP